jgi:hypothetical protein
MDGGCCGAGNQAGTATHFARTAQTHSAHGDREPDLGRRAHRQRTAPQTRVTGFAPNGPKIHPHPTTGPTTRRPSWSTYLKNHARAGNLHVRFDERDVETELRRGCSGTARRKGRQQTNRTYCYRATSRYRQHQLDVDGTGHCRTAASRMY